VALWSDLESFRQDPDDPKRFLPAGIDRIRRQLDAEAPYVAKFVTFDFFHYMSPYRGEAQRQLYEDYRARYVTGAAPRPPG
jgi:hypothetical protein